MAMPPSHSQQHRYIIPPSNEECLHFTTCKAIRLCRMPADLWCGKSPEKAGHCSSYMQVAESREMLRRLKAWRDSAEGVQWQGKREQLPVVQIRQGLVDALSQHDVAVVGGDTGCGKTTQVLFCTFTISNAISHLICILEVPVWLDMHCKSFMNCVAERQAAQLFCDATLRNVAH